MELKEIIEKCKTLETYEERLVTVGYYEVVFYTKDVGEWEKLLETIFGVAIKPEGAELSKEDAELIQKYGGARNSQVLYKKKTGNTTVVAMLWPWQDKVRITLKIISLKR